MNVYYKSNYAKNKNKDTIFYKFADGEIKEISLKEYLKAEPNKTRLEFLELKTISDEDYRQEMLLDNRELKHIIHVEDNEINSIIDTSSTPLDFMCDKFTDTEFKQSFEFFLKSGFVTKKEIKRFMLYHFNELTYDEIAEIEEVNPKRVYKSVTKFKEKAQSFLKERGFF